MSEDLYFKNLNKYPAPEDWIKFASNYRIGPVWLVDDPSLNRSIRVGKEIFVNIRGEFWRNYKELFNAETYEESVVLKFLHEIGYIVRAHSGDPKLKITSTGISEDFEKKVSQTPLNKILNDPYEKEAWDFALEIRRNQPELFQKLLNAYKTWYQNYPYAKNWG
jgi:hypothetical protein